MPQRRWTLNRHATAGLVATMASATLIGAGSVVYTAVMPIPVAKEEKPWVITTYCLHTLNIITVSIMIAGYIKVCFGKARPVQLHKYMMVVIPVLLGQSLSLISSQLRIYRMFELGLLLDIARCSTWGTRKTFFYLLVKEKLEVFVSSRACCRNVHRWVDGIIASTVISMFSAIGVSVCGVVIRAAGNDSLENPGSVAFRRSAEFSTAEVALVRLFFFLFSIGVLLYLVAGVVVLTMAGHLVRTTVAKLVGRGAILSMLSEVKRTLRLHFLGMAAGIGTAYFTIVGGILFVFKVFLTEAQIEAVSAMFLAVDIGGDTAGLLLLSGIGELLFRDDRDTGDFNHRVRSLLRSTVLTSRAEIVFEGSVFQTPNNMCIASFPGKFIEEWNELTWLCEQREMSSACVFLPTSDPGHRFGQHVQCPEDPDKRCWCYSLYGQEQPWGCLWFDIWRGNIERAVELGLDLVVIFFPGEAGRGLVDWKLLPTADLWDGVGLGGSQKAEVAFLRRRGLRTIELDLEAVRNLCLGRSSDSLRSRRPGLLPLGPTEAAGS